MTEQSLPFAAGTGWVQVRCREVIPGPQLREQVDHAVHAVYPPFANG